MRDKRVKVLELLKSIETGSQDPVGYINLANYKQHNLSSSDGLEGFGEVLSLLKDYAEAPKVNTIRAFVDGDYVFTHTEYNFFGPKVGFDVFRFEGDYIVEHWDNLCESNGERNASGHSLTDGAKDLMDMDKTLSNKNIAKAFISDIFIERKMDMVDMFFNGDSFIQHNPSVGDGVENLKKMLINTDSDSDNKMVYKVLHKVLGEGNFILCISEGLSGAGVGVPTSYYDLLRLDKDKIAEQWSVAEVILSEENRKNNNGKFNFL